MLIDKVPHKTHDSSLKKPTEGVSDPDQNAWLTVETKIALNFVDSTNPLPSRTVQAPSKPGGPLRWYARDSRDWEFPMLDWTQDLKAKFAKGVQDRGEKTWNYRFLLVTPKDYEDLDFHDYKGGWMVRPNVLCLYRLRIVAPVASCTAAETISGNLQPHNTINVVRLDPSVKSVSRAKAPPIDKDKSLTKSVGTFNGSSWRSDSNNYDDSDLWKATHNTVGHEIGHLLGEEHVVCLKNAYLPVCSPDADPNAQYGSDPNDPSDAGNIMGGGNAVTLLNARPWTNAILRHTWCFFEALTHTDLPPRKLSLNDSYAGKSTF